MKHKIKVIVETEKRGLFGRKKKVREEKTVWVDAATYRELKTARRKGENITLSGDLETILSAGPGSKSAAAPTGGKSTATSPGAEPPISFEEMILYDIIFDD